MNDVLRSPATNARIFEHALQERDVRGLAADAELRQGALGAGDRRRIVAAAQVSFASIESKCGLISRRCDRAAVEADAGPPGER